ncbi:helix-turn-helix domain-containing protein [Nocardia sp. NPDC059177]|uniref:helix-turn-helix domain-containing protein n=1 Tax=Nocardia sp. NPDC059177 TaxID=3346759 RepID=UPI00368E9B69
MEDPHASVARYLRERRESAGLTRAALGALAGISPALIQKIEQGTRTPTLEALTSLFDALEVPVPFREHLVSLSLSTRYEALVPIEVPEVPADDLALLGNLAQPACLMVYPTLDVVARNDGWARQFPGLVAGTTLLEWMLLDPIAPSVVLDWERQIHLLVYSFRVTSPGVVAQTRIDELVASCARSPAWPRLWSTEPAIPDNADAPELLLCHADTGEATRMALHNLEFSLPRRPWSLVTVAPKQTASRRMTP